MNEAFTADQISKALFEIDPMNTCCKENDCFDEYDQVAAGVVAQLEEGFDLKQALVIELAEWFFEKENLHTDCLNPVVVYLVRRSTNHV